MKGWLLVEGDDGVAIAEHMAEWANYLELDVRPVIEDEAAAEGVSRASRK